jgi:uncharacterized protein (TIGR04255 family)
MSQLPNAPLIEVIFELHWSLKPDGEMEKVRYLPGDLYAKIRGDYPHREALVPIDIPVEMMEDRPMYRFRKAEGNYPLVQVGPGLLSVNTIDPKYDWEEYLAWIVGVLKDFFSVYELSDDPELRFVLRYLDFFPFDFDHDDVSEFLKKNLHLTVEQDFFPNQSPAKYLNLTLAYDCGVGLYQMQVYRGKNQQQEGILMQTIVSQESSSSQLAGIKDWLEDAHVFTHERFTQMTKGPLYESFQQSNTSSQ